MYPLLWDLIRWAKHQGARYFDFGGVTMGSLNSEDRLGGISDFKRFFSRQVAEVGTEWAYEPRRLQAWAASAATWAASVIHVASDWLMTLAEVPWY